MLGTGDRQAGQAGTAQAGRHRHGLVSGTAQESVLGTVCVDGRGGRGKVCVRLRPDGGKAPCDLRFATVDVRTENLNNKP